MRWRAVKHVYPTHYEEHVGRLCGYTLRVRGPRGGQAYRWTVDNGGAGGHRRILETGTSVELSLAKHYAEMAVGGLP